MFLRNAIEFYPSTHFYLEIKQWNWIKLINNRLLYAWIFNYYTCSNILCSIKANRSKAKKLYKITLEERRKKDNIKFNEIKGKLFSQWYAGVFLFEHV